MNDKEWSIVKPSIVKLRASVMSVAFAVLGASGLFVATSWLLIRGGEQRGEEEVIGPHLALLGNFYPGYTVSWPGAFVGALYAGITAALAGYCLGWVYNTVALRRHK